MLLVLGASHRDLELALLDRLAAHADVLRARLAAAVSDPDGPIAGAVVLSTCNRIELYLDAIRFHDAVDLATAQLATTADLPVSEVSAALTVRAAAPVAAHLFTVAAGLDSMVVGEAEISGQVARALTAAQADGTATPVLHALFQGAARTAKRVATQTGLGSAGRSVASVALDAATAFLGRSPDSALILGTGSYARVTAAALRQRGARTLAVYSPSGRGDAFARRHDAELVTDAELVEAAATADVVVACSGRQQVITAELAERVLARSQQRDLLLVDLSLHADIDAAAADIPGVHLIDLHMVGLTAPMEHRDAVTAAQDLVIEAVARFEEDQATRLLDPVVVALRRHVSSTVDREVRRLQAKYPQAELAADLERSLHRVTQSLLHTPTLRARELARSGDAAGYAQAVHILFGIDLAAEPA